MKIHPSAKKVLDILEQNGYEAYVVGGCVRDCIMGQTPHDWDVCTSALPQQVAKCFAHCHVVGTGLQHGTLLVVVNNTPIEITTYRVDGQYVDNRRPESVTFVRSLREDLARRDFTINAMAYNPKTGLVDYFDGVRDIENKRLRSVGCPDKRFGEDALRLLRALRFASQFEFGMAPELAASIHKNKVLLKHIAAERIQIELCGILTGLGVKDILLEYPDVLGVFIPEILPMIGFAQHNYHHCYTVWEHTATAVASAAQNRTVRLAALLHDIGKPLCYHMDEKGIGHFYGHAAIGENLARTILQRLKFNCATTVAVTELVHYHDADITEKNAVKWLNRLGEERLLQLLQLKTADCTAQAPVYQPQRIAALQTIKAKVAELLEQQQCFALKDLAVNGKDLIAAGLQPGREMGIVLEALLNQVMEGNLDNNKDELIAAALAMNDVP